MLSYYFKTIIYKILTFISPVLLLKIQVRRLVGYWPNLKNPKTLNEKINWYKLYYHNPLMIKCADKAEVRNYLKSKGLEKYLNEVYGIWRKVEDINFDKLPSKFVLKSTHGTAQTIVCKDKSLLIFRKLRRK